MAGEDGLSAHIRRYLLEKANYTCEIPGCEGIKIVLDDIDTLKINSL